MEALRKGLGKRRTAEVKRGGCVTFRAPSSISTSEFDDTFEFRDFVLVETDDESSVVR